MATQLFGRQAQSARLKATYSIPGVGGRGVEPDHFCFHLSQEAQVDLIPSSDCCILIAYSENTHIGRLSCHIAIWIFGVKN